MLRLAAVSKAYGARRALVGVTLEVAAGEAVLLVGRNGAGKSTLLRIATGFIDADAGEVAIGGVDVMRERARAQAKLGYLPEHSPAPGELSVRDHLVLRARMKRVGAETVDRAMEAAGVASEAKRRIATLSKGYRQRVGLADALLGDPELLVLDEPTSGLDPIQTRELRAQLAEAARARAVLVASHAVADLEGMAARVAVLRDGELVACGTKAELCAQTGSATIDDAIVKLMGTPDLGPRTSDLGPRTSDPGLGPRTSDPGARTSDPGARTSDPGARTSDPDPEVRSPKSEARSPDRQSGE